MIYDIRQSTIYRYASSVAYARHVLRLTPIDRVGQRIHAAALDIEPAPRLRREGNDFFGNRMTWIELDQPHDTLSVRVAARVAVKRDRALDAGSTPAWEEIRAAAFGAAELSAKLARAFPLREPPSLARSGNSRLCRGELPGRPAAADCGDRPDAKDQGRVSSTRSAPPPPRPRRRCRSRCGAASARTSPTS